MNYRAPTPEGLKPKDLIGVPWKLAFALQADGWYLRTDIIWNKPNCQPESVKDRPTRSHEYWFLFSKSEKYHYDWQAIIVENGSVDDTWDKLLAIHERDPRFKVLRLARNFRMDGGLTAGLAYATGDQLSVLRSEVDDEHRAVRWCGVHTLPSVMDSVEDR